MTRMIHLEHLIFTPKYRRPLLEDAHARRLVEYCMTYIARKHGITIHAIALQPDHVHVFAELPRTMSVAQAAHLLKWFSSYHTRRLRPDLKAQCPKAFWGVRYFYRSVSLSGDSKNVRNYINKQVSHFSTADFAVN